ncbi:MAG: phosphate ABC transporter permease subunit PstC [Defluviitaleaceae bacterium]|nr:phosphate ABC transporter permease subunit PstC [Defluviitaleaceae bacterium]
MLKFKENLPGYIFFGFALSAIAALFTIAMFIFREGIPVIIEYGFINFITGTTWAPTRGDFGILPMIVGSLSVAVGAAIIGVPFGVCCAIYMAEFAPEKMKKVLRPTIQLLAGIPSVVYGFWGLVFIVPFIRNNLGGNGFSLLAASVVLGIMILPTIISISEVSIIAQPKTYKEGALAMGLTRWQTICKVQLPAARSGIIAGIILGMGRAIGETMAVIMVLGSAAQIPKSLLDSARTLTINIGLEMSYAVGTHRQSLFATGVVLFVIIMILNILAQYFTRQRVKKV